MNNIFNPSRFWVVLWILGAMIVAKSIWVAAQWFVPLPLHGIEQEHNTLRHALHYKYRLASDTNFKAPKKSVQTKPAAPKASLSSYKLIGIYSKGTYAIVTLIKGGKSFVLATGDHGGELEGYHLDKVGVSNATFKKGDEIAVLKLFDIKSSAIRESKPDKKVTIEPKKKKKKEPKIVDDGDVKRIDRSLIQEYTENPDKIWKNIGLYEVTHEGKLDGFKVRFVRRGSPFEKLGLKRGDVIKAINGEPIVDYATPLRMLRSADTIDDLSLTIERNQEEQELKYEVK